LLGRLTPGNKVGITKTSSTNFVVLWEDSETKMEVPAVSSSNNEKLGGHGVLIDLTSTDEEEETTVDVGGTKQKKTTVVPRKKSSAPARTMRTRSSAPKIVDHSAGEVFEDVGFSQQIAVFLPLGDDDDGDSSF